MKKKEIFIGSCLIIKLGNWNGVKCKFYFGAAI